FRHVDNLRCVHASLFPELVHECGGDTVPTRLGRSSTRHRTHSGLLGCGHTPPADYAGFVPQDFSGRAEKQLFVEDRTSELPDQVYGPQLTVPTSTGVVLDQL